MGRQRRRLKKQPCRREHLDESRAIEASMLSNLAIQLINGLADACAMFLVASGLSLIFGVTRIVNFAHGSFYMLGIYIAYMLTDKLGGGAWFWASLLLAAIAVGVIGALVEMVLLRRVYRAPE